MISVIKYITEDKPPAEEANEKREEAPGKNDNFVRCALTKFLTENPNPDDNDFHLLADKLKVDPSELEEIAYGMLAALLKGVGKHKDVPITNFDPEQIKMGMEVEKEHTDNEALTQQIAKDHLAEIPDYYTRLKKMEDEAKKELGKKD